MCAESDLYTTKIINRNTNIRKNMVDTYIVFKDLSTHACICRFVHTCVNLMTMFTNVIMHKRILKYTYAVSRTRF